jgi:hypothetical protein
MDTTTTVTAIDATIKALPSSMTTQSLIISTYGFDINIMAVVIATIALMILVLFYRIQKSAKLDFADMVTKDGKSVSLTKVLQLIGGLTATWIMIKLTLTGGLTEALFGLYLTYVGAIEGYSKFVAAKYNYTELSVKNNSVENMEQK